MAETKETQRPTYRDPKEWAIIRSMYFNDQKTSNDPDKAGIDPLELNDRMNHKPNRNQHR